MLSNHLFAYTTRWARLTSAMQVYVLWFKFILGLIFFELVSILFAIVPDYGNEYMTKKN